MAIQSGWPLLFEKNRGDRAARLLASVRVFYPQAPKNPAIMTLDFFNLIPATSFVRLNGDLYVFESFSLFHTC